VSVCAYVCDCVYSRVRVYVCVRLLEGGGLSQMSLFIDHNSSDACTEHENGWGVTGIRRQQWCVSATWHDATRCANHCEDSAACARLVEDHVLRALTFTKQHVKLKTLKLPHWSRRRCACMCMCVRACTIVDGLFSEGSNIRHGDNRRELGDLRFIIFSFQRSENSNQSHRFCCTRFISVVHVSISCLMAFTCHSPDKPISTVKIHHRLASFIHASPEWTDKGESFIVF